MAAGTSARLRGTLADPAMVIGRLLGTPFPLWIVLGAERLEPYPGLDRYRPWGVSPASLLEIACLAEAGRLVGDRLLARHGPVVAEVRPAA